jgi:hypothetical protein
MTHILLVGRNAPLLEGLAQSFAALGQAPHVVLSLAEARELSMTLRPLVAVVDHELVADATGDAFGLALAAGGAIVLFRTLSDTYAAPLPIGLQRQVLAELTLPLERNRLVALVQTVTERARATGRGHTGSDDEQFGQLQR